MRNKYQETIEDVQEIIIDENIVRLTYDVLCINNNNLTCDPRCAAFSGVYTSQKKVYIKLACSSTIYRCNKENLTIKNVNILDITNKSIENNPIKLKRISISIKNYNNSGLIYMENIPGIMQETICCNHTFEKHYKYCRLGCPMLSIKKDTKHIYIHFKCCNMTYFCEKSNFSIETTKDKDHVINSYPITNEEIKTLKD